MKSYVIVPLLVSVPDGLELILKLLHSSYQENCLLKYIVFNKVVG
jgi:hypothetical protein